MAIHPITNSQFNTFVNDTGYLTVAERQIDWLELKKQLPPNTLEPHDSIIKAPHWFSKKPRATCAIYTITPNGGNGRSARIGDIRITCRVP